MSTLTNLKNTIYSDLHRSDLTAQASAAITAAIKHYERERLWFLEGRSVTTTTASVAFYSMPSDFKQMDSLLVTISGSKTPLVYKDYIEMDEKDSGVYTGTPAEWAYYQDNIRLYPVPNGAYVLTMSYHRKLETSDSSSNGWTNDAFDLIRFRAEKDIYQNYLRNIDMANAMQDSEVEAYMSIVRENTGRLATGRVKKSGW